MKNKIVLILVFVFILTSCSNKNNVDYFYSGAKIVNSKKSINDIDMFGIENVVDNKIIYFNYEDESKRNYYIYDVEDENEKEIFTGENILFSSGLTAGVNDNIYTNLILEHKNNQIINNLVQINTDTLDFEIISEDNCNEETTSFICATETDILLIKHSVNEKTSQVVLYDIENNEYITIIEKKFAVENGKNQGVFLNGIAYDSGYLYVIEENYENHLMSIQLVKYNLQGEYISSIDLREIYSYIEDEAVGKFFVFGDYMFVRNYSGKGVVCRIIDDNAEIHFEVENDLDIVRTNKDTEQNQYIFYSRREGKDIKVLDINTGKMETVTLNIGDEIEVIRYIYGDEYNNLLVGLVDPEDENLNNENRFYVNLCDFIE